MTWEQQIGEFGRCGGFLPGSGSQGLCVISHLLDCILSFRFSRSYSSALEFAFLAGARVMLMLLVQGGCT